MFNVFFLVVIYFLADKPKFYFCCLLNKPQVIDHIVDNAADDYGIIHRKG
jgi:hypothetical protein